MGNDNTDFTSRIPSHVYDKHYYLTSERGCEEFIKYKGVQFNRIMEYAFQLADLHAGMNILDVGCGRGEVVCRAARMGVKAMGIDYSPDAIAIADDLREDLPDDSKKYASFRCMDATCMDFAKGSFDAVFMLDFVEHIIDSDLVTIVNQCHNILKDGGKIIVHTAPTREYMRIGQYVRKAVRWSFRTCTFQEQALQSNHINFFTRTKLSELLGAFLTRNVFYKLSFEDDNALRKLADMTFIKKYLSMCLFAVAIK